MKEEDKIGAFIAAVIGVVLFAIVAGTTASCIFEDHEKPRVMHECAVACENHGGMRKMERYTCECQGGR